ncbi:MAG: hypothetical protein AVDCRST_MAG74-3457 [uncultured Pyrinomonadaceae bacterium]|uniref:Zinc-ribbon domain-containing protein n=1 Tax=uncultured Pyrinomonadaceae bacterium TaxID=2283094 RepID=A0A6J4PW99_9BACT|nr:MAG: hypothetical protein AVDCRST_MAG74-3457 [uncultured Pyrinomonadaceae bacterium]
MFCPKCGVKNPEAGKFCRSCGTDLSQVSDVLSGKSSNEMPGFGMMIQPIQPVQPINLLNRRGRPVNLEGVLSTLFTGFAFLVISIILGVTGMAGGRHWWFWLLIPAFTMLGTGVAQYIQLKKNEQKFIPNSEQPETAKSFNQTTNASLPPIQTDYAATAPGSRYKTGDLVPPSVAEGTTRHLEMNSEGETMTLPKK